MELLDEATLAGLKLYKWNEKLAYNNVPTHQGLFVFRRAEDKFVRRVLQFRMDDLLIYEWEDSTQLVTRYHNTAIISVLTKLVLFEPQLVLMLAHEIELLLFSSFRFTPYTASSPQCPRLVLVADISYTEAAARRVPWAPRLILGGAPEENTNAETQPSSELSDDDSDMLDYMEGFEDDVEDTYNDEMIEIAAELRMLFCVSRTYPLEPWNPSEPLGLTEQKSKLEIGFYKVAEEPSDCAICFETLSDGQLVLKTGCGHVFHKTCSIPWFSTAFTCPMCRADTLTVI